MIQHLKRGALQSLGCEGKNPQDDQSHMADGGICHKLFQVRLHHGYQRAIDDADDCENGNVGRRADRRGREQRADRNAAIHRCPF